MSDKNIPITESYQKARRVYAGFSALLLAWEFIGIGITEANISTLKIEIKSPDAIPFVLLVLVIYFAYRLSNEWMMLSKQVRGRKYAKIDLFLSHLIAGISIAVFIFQLIIDAQIFELVSINPSTVLYYIFGATQYAVIKAIRFSVLNVIRLKEFFFGAMLYIILIIAVVGLGSIVFFDVVRFNFPDDDLHKIIFPIISGFLIVSVTEAILYNYMRIRELLKKIFEDAR